MSTKNQPFLLPKTNRHKVYFNKDRQIIFIKRTYYKEVTAMKLKFKSIVAGIVIGSAITSSVNVFAYDGTQDIQATFKNIKIYIDGAELTPKDASGNTLEPFIYNGSTYLPIRAVAEAVNKEVSYDANTNSVYLGDSNTVTKSQANGAYLEPYTGEAYDFVDITMGGVKYTNALRLSYQHYYGNAYYNLSGKYTTFSGVYGFADGRISPGTTATLKFYGDGILLGEYTLNAGDLPKNFTLNVTGVTQLMIENPGGSGPYVADMAFK
jgi:hypothetical protein